MNLEALRPQLERLFQGHPVLLAYVFGSRATGHVHPESDVDVAVLVDESLSADARYSERLALTGELSRLFRSDRIDVVVLNEASPLLAYEALRNGVCVYSASDDVRIEFQVRTVREYEDTSNLRRILSEAMAERVRAGSFGRPVLPEGS